MPTVTDKPWSHISKVHDEAVPSVETGPAQRDLGGSDNPPALDVKESLCCKLVGDDMVETRGHAPCLRKQRTVNLHFCPMRMSKHIYGRQSLTSGPSETRHPHFQINTSSQIQIRVYTNFHSDNTLPGAIP